MVYGEQKTKSCNDIKEYTLGSFVKGQLRIAIFISCGREGCAHGRHVHQHKYSTPAVSPHLIWVLNINGVQ